MIINRIIHNEKLCKPFELTKEQINEIKEFQKKEQVEKESKEKLERERVRIEYESLTDEEKKKLGLGDLVAKITQPIAKGIDSIAGTNIQNCGGCKKRQKLLNNIIPDISLK